MPLAKRGLLVFLSAVASLAPLARADLRTFQKIVDTNTPIPGGTGNFSSLTHAQVPQNNVVFAGNGASNQRGIYRFNPATSALSTVVDQNTVLPGSPPSILST